MRKFLIGLLMLILINVLGLLILSFTLKNILVDGIIKEVIINQIKIPSFETPNIKNEIITEENINRVTNNDKVKEILKSEEANELINKYFDMVIEGLIDEENLDDVEIEKDMIKYLRENKDKLEKITGHEITDEDIKKVEEQIKELEIDKNIKEGITKTSEYMPEETKVVLKGYKFLISLKFRLILIAIMILDLILIALLQKSFYKWIKLFGIALTTDGIFTIVIGGIVYFIVYVLTRIKFNIKFLIIVGIIITVIGILIQIIYNILTKNKEVTNNEVPQIS